MRSAPILALLACIATAADCGAAERFLALQIGAPHCPRLSNSDQVECDADRGRSFALGVGRAVPLARRLDLRLSAKAMALVGPLHGRNDGDGRDGAQQRSADGESIRIYGLLGSAELAFELVRPLPAAPIQAFFGLAAGGCVASAFGDAEPAACASGRAGLRLGLGRSFLDLGYGAFALTPTDHATARNSYRARYWDHGPLLAIGLHF